MRGDTVPAGDAAGWATRSRRGTDVESRCRPATAATGSGRSPVGRPVPARARQRRVPGRALRPRPRLQARDQPAHRTGSAHRRGRRAAEPVQPRPLGVPRAAGARRRQAGAGSRSHTRAAKLRVTPARPVAGRFTVEVRYVGQPRTGPQPWGDVGWDELTDGVLVASQPIGAPSWFPCNDHPSDKATYRIAVTTAAPYRVVANGVLTARRRSAGTRTWVYEQPEPTASYLVSVQIGRYDEVVRRRRPGATGGAAPGPAAQERRARLRPAARDHEGASRASSGPTRSPTTSSSSPTTSWRSHRGPGHVDLRGEPPRRATHPRAARRARAGAPVVRQQPHDRRLAPHLAATRASRCYAEWLWSEESGGRAAAAHAREWHARAGREACRTSSSPTRGPRGCSTTGSTSAAR